MKKSNKIGVIVAVALVAILTITLVVINPFGSGDSNSNRNPATNDNPTVNGNSGPDGNPTENNSNSGNPGEPTNPGNETLKTTFGISPGKFWLDDEDHITKTTNPSGTEEYHTTRGLGAYQAGESVEGQLWVENKNDFAAEFSVAYRVPDFVAEGYSRPTEEVRDWVRISSGRLTIPAHATVAITIRLKMPTHATAPGDKWEFWIGVIDKSQTGWIRTELGNRWLVTMK